MKEKWIAVKNDLTKEFQIVKEISFELSCFKDRPNSSRILPPSQLGFDDDEETTKHDPDVWPAPPPIVKKQPMFRKSGI